MISASATSAYSRIAVAIHWLSAILIVILLLSGFGAGAVLRIHVPAGLTLLVLTLARVVWFWIVEAKPEPPDGPAWRGQAAGTVHLMLYVVILGMTASGIGMLALSGAGSVLFADAPGPLPDFRTVPPRVPHGIGARLLIALLAVHIGAALYHHYALKDAILRRMWFSR